MAQVPSELPKGGLVASCVPESAAPSYDGFYDYDIPAALQDKAQAGMRAVVPFGSANAERLCMIWRVYPAEEAANRPRKPILALPDDEPVLTEELRFLAEWLHEHTFCTWSDAVRQVLPGGMRLSLGGKYRLGEISPAAPLSEPEAALLLKLRREGAKEFSAPLSADKEERALFQSLAAKGALIPESKSKVAPLTRRLVRLSDRFLTNPADFSPTPKQERVLDILREEKELPVKECAYRAGVTDVVVKNLIKSGAAESFEREMTRARTGAKAVISPDDTVLTDEQQSAYDAVARSIAAGKAAAFLLQGVTGSGKTAVYEKLIAFALSLGRTALLLIPEISLTPQTVAYFEARFGDAVALIHSGLSLAQRLDTDKRIRRGEASIVIGTRSAVFAPLEHIGLVILDEEGDHSYRSEQSPRYHAAEVAKARARFHSAAIVFGSATPSLESRWRAENGVYTLLRLTKRYRDVPLPEVRIVDMNAERARGNDGNFSLELTNALRETLRRGEQSILLLNRRGYRTLLQCPRCHEPLCCPNCAVPLTYHKANDSLLCHYCGYLAPADLPCPHCGRTDMIRTGFGTQKLEEELAALIPEARLLRMDADTTVSRDSYERNFRAFAAREYDILCGTQMIGKGLDFPNVTLVGVISCDSVLFSGDFRSYERTFSLLTQVVGRGGRRETPGRAILQTFLPEHYIIYLAAAQDYERFYREEIALRKSLLFPPVCDICAVWFSSLSQEAAREGAVWFQERLTERIAARSERERKEMPLVALGVSEPPIPKLRGKYRLRILLKCKDTPPLRAMIRQLLQSAVKEPLFRQVTVYAEMNGDC